MTARRPPPGPEQVALINQALRRETLQRTRNGEKLYRAEWIELSRLRGRRWRRRAADLWHALEFLAMLFVVAFIGGLLFALIDAII